MREPRTQKAKGIVALSDAGLSVPWFRVIADADDIPDAIKFLRYRSVTYAFARPCPSRPRHGFVESRPVNLTNPEKAAAEIRALLEHARDFDPLAEIVLMNYLPAEYNVIVTPGAVVIGPEHDGATAGIDTITIPWIGFDPEHPRNAAVVEAIKHADIHESPYFEFVITKAALSSTISEAQAVQLRDGPRVSAASDFIPKRIIVGRVITISDPEELDLLAWEDVVRELSPDSDVVYFPGGSLASHAAVHCIARGIAVVTSHEPTIGEVLEPPAESTYDLNRFLEGLEHGLVVPLNVFEHENIRAARFGLYALHNAGALVGQHTYYLGLGVGVMLRAGLALVLGELRHHPLGVELLSTLGFYPAEREYVYEYVLGKYPNFLKALSLVPAALDLFRNATWRESYGGPAWYSCAERWFRLAAAVAAFIVEQSREAFGTVLHAFNDMVHEAHNNGWWFNKMLSESEFDFAVANHPRFAACAAVFAHEVLRSKEIPEFPDALGRFCEALPKPSQTEPSLLFAPPFSIDRVSVSVDSKRLIFVFEAHDADGNQRSIRGSIKHAARASALRAMLKQAAVESLVVPVTQHGYYLQFQIDEYHVCGTVEPKAYAFDGYDDDWEEDEDEDSYDD